MNKLFYLFCGICLTVTTVFGQTRDWIWPEDRVKAEENVALYSDYLSLKDYRQAADYLSWLIINAPNLNISLYQNGSKIYENLALNDTNEINRGIFLDSMLWMYDTRMKYFGDSVNVMNRKVNKAYTHFFRSKDKLKFLLLQFDITFSISGNEVLNSNIPAYMNVIKLNKLTYDNLTIEEVLNRYDKITQIIDFKIKNGETLERQKELVDRLLTETIPEGIDCEFVKEKMGPEFYEDPTNIPHAKKVFNFMLRSGCTDEELFFDAAIAVHRNEPTYTIGYKLIGKRCFVEKDYECAAIYFQEAIKLARTKTERIDVLIDLARLYTKQKNKIRAREYYQDVIRIDAHNKEAFDGIGNLYFYSAQECAELKNRMYDRLIYIAAFEKFQKSGNRKMMEASQKQFPSTEDIFRQNMESGDVVRVNCWVNESLVLRARPSGN